jgi:hypothetical protein
MAILTTWAATKDGRLSEGNMWLSEGDGWLSEGDIWTK